LRLVDHVRRGANPSTAEAQLNGLAPLARGQWYGMGRHDPGRSRTCRLASCGEAVAVRRGASLLQM